MGIPVLVLGESGSGKTSSLRYFTSSEVGIFNVAGKPLPFRKRLPAICGASYSLIQRKLQRASLRSYVIDDSQYLLAFAAFSRAREKGYDKFTDIAMEFYGLLRFIVTPTPPDCIVYFLHHSEVTETGRIKAKTLGRLLDNHLTLEGLFSIVLLCRTDGASYWFETQSDGMSTAKSPRGMFPARSVVNDLKAVDLAIRQYWQLDEKRQAEGGHWSTRLDVRDHDQVDSAEDSFYAYGPALDMPEERALRTQRAQPGRDALREQRTQTAREQATREQPSRDFAREAAAREASAREQAAREQSSRDTAREQAAREQAARDQSSRDTAREQAAREAFHREQASGEQREQAVSEGCDPDDPLSPMPQEEHHDA